MKKQLPMTSDDFIQHLQDAGLVPHDVLVNSVTLTASRGHVVTLHLEIFPGVEIAETIK